MTRAVPDEVVAGSSQKMLYLYRVMSKFRSNEIGFFSSDAWDHLDRLRQWGYK